MPKTVDELFVDYAEILPLCVDDEPLALKQLEVLEKTNPKPPKKHRLVYSNDIILYANGVEIKLLDASLHQQRDYILTDSFRDPIPTENITEFRMVAQNITNVQIDALQINIPMTLAHKGRIVAFTPYGIQLGQEITMGGLELFYITIFTNNAELKNDLYVEY